MIKHGMDTFSKGSTSAWSCCVAFFYRRLAVSGPIHATTQRRFILTRTLLGPDTSYAVSSEDKKQNRGHVVDTGLRALLEKAKCCDKLQISNTNTHWCEILDVLVEEVLEKVNRRVKDKPSKIYMEALYALLKGIFDSGKNISPTQQQSILHIAAYHFSEEKHLALKTLYMSILTCKNSMSKDAVKRIGDVLDIIRSSPDPTLQLEVVHCYYALVLEHPYVIGLLERRHKAYLEYIKEMSHEIMFKVLHEVDKPQITSLRCTLDALQVEHYAAITGTVTNNRQNSLRLRTHLPTSNLKWYAYGNRRAERMVRYEKTERYWSSDEECSSVESAQPINVRQQLLKIMGWKLHCIPQKQWDALQTEGKRAEFIANLIAEMYVEAQFVHRPRCVPPCPVEA
ncbi:blood stage antigen 41-3, putative [Babesia caballi]|uniref:Blood stage antigen 41-3, putative n=1 Tax=Babesia caballi TaxID=5871 RepID=A0AAV4LUS2_BABCB|nr:blood stage antigen 41-3, putative [Babesia caballi]